MWLCLSCSARFLRFFSTSSRFRLGVCCLSMAFMGSLLSMLMSIVLFWILISAVSVLSVLRLSSPFFSVCMSSMSVGCGFSVGRVCHFFSET